MRLFRGVYDDEQKYWLMSVQGGTLALEGRRPSGQLQTSVCWPGGIACAEWHTANLTFNLDVSVVLHIFNPTKFLVHSGLSLSRRVGARPAALRISYPSISMFPCRSL